VRMMTIRDIYGDYYEGLSFDVNMTAEAMADRWRDLTEEESLIQFVVEDLIPPEFLLMQDLIARERWTVLCVYSPAGY